MERMGQNQRLHVCFVQFARWWHLGLHLVHNLFIELVLVLCVEVDHGYASTQPMPYQRPRQRSKSRTKVHGSLHRCVFSELGNLDEYWDLSCDSNQCLGTRDFHILY